MGVSYDAWCANTCSLHNPAYRTLLGLRAAVGYGIYWRNFPHNGESKLWRVSIANA